MTSTGARIAAVICTYNRYDCLPGAIESCLLQSISADACEIIVVDNSPDHDAARAFGRQYDGVKNLTYLVETTPGLSNARNVAARASDAEIIAYLDDDAVADPSWLEALVRAFDVYGEQAQVAGGRILPLWDVPRPGWLHDQNLGYVSVVDWGGSLRILRDHEWIAGANISFRRKPLLAVGGFDSTLGRKGPETSLLSNEENAVLDKMSEGGGQILYVPEASVSHLVDRRRLKHEWFRRRSAWQAVSDYLKDPEIVSGADAAFDRMLDYLHRQPPRYRTIAGLRRDVDDPEDFRDQLEGIYNLTVALLSGLKGLP